jgi:hypothetical protein
MTEKDSQPLCSVAQTFPGKRFRFGGKRPKQKGEGWLLINHPLGRSTCLPPSALHLKPGTLHFDAFAVDRWAHNPAVRAQ